MSPGRWVTVLAAAVILGVAALLCLVSLNERSAALAGAEREAGNLAHTIEYHTEQLFGGIENVLADADEAIAAGRSDRLKRLIPVGLARLYPVRTVWTFDADGILRQENGRPPIAPFDVSGQDFFDVHLRDPGGGLFIGAPMQLPGGEPFIPISRRIFSPVGFAGVLVAVVDLELLHEFYGAWDLGARGSFSLYRQDAILLAQQPIDLEGVGRRAAHRQQFWERVSIGQRGTFHQEEPIGGEARIISYRALPDYPLIVVVSSSRAEVLRMWRQHLIGYAAAGTTVALAIVALALLLNRALHRRELDRRRLEEAERDYRSLFDNAVDGIVRLSPSGRVLRANPAMVRLAGFRNEESMLAHRRAWMGWYVDPTRGPELLRRLERDGEAKEVISEIRRHGTGERIWVSESFRAVRGSKGEVCFYESSVRDMSRIKEAEAALISAKEQAEAASRAKSEFLANMSHELRTPLNAIIGFSEMMVAQLFGPLSDRYASYVGDILSSARHLLEVINDILDLAKVEAGQLGLREAPIDTGALLDGCVRLLAERAAGAGVTIELGDTSEAPAIWGDETRLRQIVLNLITNAVKFTPAGGRIRVDAELRGDKVSITVRDTGIGMTEPEIRRALQPFTQIESAMTRRHDGTGLGLPLTKALTERHGGELAITSAPDIGTTVEVRLPAHLKAEEHRTIEREPAIAVRIR